MEFLKTIGDIPQYLICPICIELPKNKVLQCTNGHTFCEDCSSKLNSQNCPQCREQLGMQEIRNLVVENMLDELRLECPYKNSGCGKIIDRKIFQEHLRSCCFNFAKFGPFSKVCQAIGYKDCNFQMNKGNTVEAMAHFEEAHGAVISSSETVHIKSTQLSPKLAVILDREREGYIFLIVVALDEEIKTLSWAPYFFRYSSSSTSFDDEVSSDPYQLSCSLKGTENKNSLTWTISPINIFLSKNHGWESPHASRFTMPITMFRSGGVGSLQATVRVLKLVVENESDAENENGLEVCQDIEEDSVFENEQVETHFDFYSAHQFRRSE